MTNHLKPLHNHLLESLVGPPSSGGALGVSSLIRNFVNNQGSNLVLGDVVSIDTSGDNLIKKTTTAGDLGVLGVVAGTGPFANGDNTPILIAGYHASVKVTGAIARGDFLQASDTDGTAETIAVPDAGTFARVVADDAGGFAACVVFAESLGGGSSGLNVYDATSLTDGVETTFTTPSAFISGTTRVFLNGVLQRNGADYTESGSDIIMTDPPGNDDELIIVFGAEGDSVTTFLGLSDTPSTYAGEAGKVATVKGDETGLEFTTPAVAVAFTDLTDVDNDYTSDQSKAVRVNTGATGLGFGTPAARVNKSTDFSHNSSSSWLPITFDTEVYDSYGLHDTSSNTSRFTIPSGMNGVWHFGGCLQWDTNTTGNRIAGIRVNGSIFIVMEGNNPPVIGRVQNISVDISLSAGDYVELCAWQDSGGTRSILAVSAFSPFFWCHMVGA